MQKSWGEKRKKKILRGHQIRPERRQRRKRTRLASPDGLRLWACEAVVFGWMAEDNREKRRGKRKTSLDARYQS
jgi:hypothetical protein